MSCIIWMLLRANNVWGNCLEYWQLRSALSGVLMVCFVRTLFLWSFQLLCLFGDCVCLYRRCCPGRHVVFSRTPSSIKTTRAARMNWTSSSMAGNSSSLFCWTPWVNYSPTRHIFCLTHLETHLASGANWNLNEKQDNDSSVTHPVMSASCFLILH